MDEKMKELSQVLPSEIEARSFEIITEELGERTFPEKEDTNCETRDSHDSRL